MNKKDPLGMIADPFTGDSFIFPDALCTEQRRLWFKRTNEIYGFLMLTEFSLLECRNKYQKILESGKLASDTPFKIDISDGKSLVTPFGNFIRHLSNNINVLCRQIFVMFYGSLETYLFELIERSLKEIGKTEDMLQASINIMMGSNWDGKFCKMRDIFNINYKANDLKVHFQSFKMNFEGKEFNNPLLFLDELAKVRHKIVHASSIMEEGKVIYVPANIFHSLYAFCSLLTDYIDKLFSAKFGYNRIKINPAHA